MSLQSIQTSIPDFAKDIKLNLSSILNTETPLSKQQLWGVILASAVACKNSQLLNAVMEDAKTHLTSEAISAAKSAAVLMAMNNVYYRFRHSLSNEEYAKMPANLRMTVMAQPGIDKKDFELFSLAVSAINGCSYCMDSHEKSLIKLGITKEQIQATGRIAAIINAVGVTLTIQ